MFKLLDSGGIELCLHILPSGWIWRLMLSCLWGSLKTWLLLIDEQIAFQHFLRATTHCIVFFSVHCGGTTRRFIYLLPPSKWQGTQGGDCRCQWVSVSNLTSDPAAEPYIGVSYFTCLDERDYIITKRVRALEEPDTCLKWRKSLRIKKKKKKGWGIKKNL